jgi:hypothetical protein
MEYLYLCVLLKSWDFGLQYFLPPHRALQNLWSKFRFYMESLSSSHISKIFHKKKLEIIWTSNVTHGQDDKLSIIFFRATRGDKNQKLSQNRKIFSYLNICERIYLKTNGKDSKHIILRWYEILINRINYRLIVRASMREPLLLNIKSALKNQLLLTGCGDSWL